MPDVREAGYYWACVSWGATPFTPFIMEWIVCDGEGHWSGYWSNYTEDQFFKIVGPIEPPKKLSVYGILQI